MSELPKEPIFFNEGHRAFLERPSADVLNFDTLRPHLRSLMTRVRLSRDDDGCALMVGLGMFGIMIVGAVAFMLIGGAVLAIQAVTENGFPNGQVILKQGAQWGVFALTLLLLLPYAIRALQMSVAMFSYWPYPRIAGLISKIAEDGVLLEGRLQPITVEHQIQRTLPYIFTTPSGVELEREFYLDEDEYPKVYYPEMQARFQPGTPVWVLYLNDKISVLL